jgi:IS5 family transposase
MLKILLLQRLYDLSDPEMEHQLYDRLSFRMFCGFGMAEALPDETTLCRFRGQLQNKTEPLFELILGQIEAKGLVLKKGTLVDASIIKAQCRPPKAGEVSEVDPQAGWTKKGDAYTYGYKAHVGVDQGSGIIVKAETTSANVHDSQMLPHVVTGEEEAVYADKAYDSDPLRRCLTKAGIKARLLKRKPRGQAMSKRQQVLNKAYSRIRCHVERTFAHMKVHYHYRRARYRGWAQNQVHLHLLAMIYNLKKAVKMLARSAPWHPSCA